MLVCVLVTDSGKRESMVLEIEILQILIAGLESWLVLENRIYFFMSVGVDCSQTDPGLKLAECVYSAILWKVVDI